MIATVAGFRIIFLTDMYFLSCEMTADAIVQPYTLSASDAAAVKATASGSFGRRAFITGTPMNPTLPMQEATV